MKNWNSLLIRQGFMVKEVSCNQFDCTRETTENMTFLLESLNKLGIIFSCHNGMLHIENPAVSEEEWLSAVDFEYRGNDGSVYFRPSEQEPRIWELDTYIAGVIRHLNRLGLHTEQCCDGHDSRRPLIYFSKETDLDTVEKVLKAVGVPRLLIQGRNVSLLLKREQLLDVAERLNQLQPEWIHEGEETIRKQLFLQRLEQCLSISG